MHFGVCVCEHLRVIIGSTGVPGACVCARNSTAHTQHCPSLTDVYLALSIVFKVLYSMVGYLKVDYTIILHNQMLFLYTLLMC